MGLESLDLESAKRLANAKCAARDGIYLDSVTEVSPEVVNVLANGNSGLSLQGLEFIDDSTEQALVDAKKKLKAMGRFLERPAPSHPFLKLEFGGRNGSAKKGETLAMSWKLRGQSVESIGVQAIHIKDGESRVVSQVSCPVNGKRSMEVQFQLENLVEQLRSEGNLFLPSISVAVDGASTHAEQSEKFTMLGKFGISSYTTKSSEVGELLVAVGISDGDSTDGIDHDTTRSVEKMIVASKKGVEFLVLNLSSRFIDDVTGKFGGAARKN
jgi:hypothetical protein